MPTKILTLVFLALIAIGCAARPGGSTEPQDPNHADALAMCESEATGDALHQCLMEQCSTICASSEADADCWDLCVYNRTYEPCAVSFPATLRYIDRTSTTHSAAITASDVTGFMVVRQERSVGGPECIATFSYDDGLATTDDVRVRVSAAASGGLNAWSGTFERTWYLDHQPPTLEEGSAFLTSL
jgi:hypothetical protein